LLLITTANSIIATLPPPPPTSSSYYYYHLHHHHHQIRAEIEVMTSQALEGPQLLAEKYGKYVDLLSINCEEFVEEFEVRKRREEEEGGGGGQGRKLF